MNQIKYIAFDADDTLWECEPLFRSMELKVCELLKEYMPIDQLLKKILDDHIANLPLYGYGVKGYILSLTETAIHISQGNVSQEVIDQILQYGKQMLNAPVELINEVEKVLPRLKEHFKLLLITKGDLLDQQRKLQQSGLAQYFDQVEILSDKRPDDYQKLLARLNIKPEEFMMVGNSLKSDILPVIRLGAKGVHIPYKITWEHEKVENIQYDQKQLFHINKMDEIYSLVGI